MIYRQYGKTGKMVSALGLGTMRLNKNDEDSCIEVIRAAIDRGVNYIDVAHSYLGGKAESIVGKAISTCKGDLFITTKSSSLLDPDADAVRRRLESSLWSLDVPKISFYCMWTVGSSEQYKFIMKKGGPYDGAVKAKEEGLIEHIVVSCHCDLHTVRQIINDAAFEGITLSVNVMNMQSLRNTLDLSAKQGMGVVTMNPLGGGIIPKHIDYFSQSLRVGRENTIPKLLRFNAELPGVTVTLCGMSSTEEVIANTEAFTRRENILSIDALPVISDLCTACGYCTQLSNCPANIPVSEYMSAFNSSIFVGSEDEKAQADLVFSQLRSFYGIVPDVFTNPCTECGNCEQVCTQHLQIMERLREIYKWSKRYHYNLADMKARIADILAGAETGKIGITPAGYEVNEFLKFIKEHFPGVMQRLILIDVDKSKIGKMSQGVPICGSEDIKKVRTIIIAHFNLQEKKFEELSDCQVNTVKLYKEDSVRWF